MITLVDLYYNLKEEREDLSVRSCHKTPFFSLLTFFKKSLHLKVKLN